MSSFGLVHAPALAIAVAAAVIVPLGLAAIDEPDRAGRRSRLIVTARWWCWPAALGVLAALGQPAGWLASALVVPWAILAVMIALHGAARLAARGLAPASEVGVAVAMLYLAGAATWLFAHRAGVALLGYPPYWVALTAAHFHVAAFALPAIAGLHARAGGKLGAVAVWAVVLGVPMTAGGIAWSRALEVAGGLVTAAGGLLVAGLAVAATRRSRGLARGLHVISALALACSMPLAAAYLLRLDVRVGELDPLSSMAATHGALNVVAVAAAFGALILARRARTASACGQSFDIAGSAGTTPAWPRGVPLSRLAARGRVGPDFFARAGLLVEAPDRAGLVDRLEDLAHPGFDPATVAPAIRRFYERTADHVLEVRPTWRRGFRIGGRIWAALARRIGQLGLPVSREPGDGALVSRIVGLDDDGDGRRRVRGWVRTYRDERVMYVAAYATHHHAGTGYMNIAFALPRSNLTSILRVDRLPGGPAGDAVAVSTTRAGACSDVGIYLVLARGRLPVRLPFSEEIRVWTPDMPDVPAALRDPPPGTTVVARHELWLCGVRYLTLDYVISERIAAA